MQKIITIDLGGVNSYLICNNGKYALVDTGGHMFMDKEYDDRQEKLVKALDNEGVNKENLELMILTHGDNDHVHNAAYIAKNYNAKIAMHSDDVWMVEKKEPECYRINSKYQSAVLGFVFRMMDKKITKLMQRVTDDFNVFRPDIMLEEGKSLEEYGFDGMIYNCPGHTKGSICIIDHEGNVICGDLFANNKKPSLAINAANFAQLNKSAKKVLSLATAMIYPGHGTPFKACDFKL